MAIIPWDPFQEVERFFNQDNFLPILPARWLKFPLTDIYKERNNLVIKMQIPDIDPKKIEVSIEDNVLHVRGKMSEKKEEKKRNYYQKEIRKTDFQREVALPTEVQAKKAKATYQDGALTVKIPEAKRKTASAKIPIQIKG